MSFSSTPTAGPGGLVAAPTTANGASPNLSAGLTALGIPQSAIPRISSALMPPSVAAGGGNNAGSGGSSTLGSGLLEGAAAGRNINTIGQSLGLWGNGSPNSGTGPTWDAGLFSTANPGQTDEGLFSGAANTGFLSNVGSAIGNAASSVGNFVGSLF